MCHNIIIYQSLKKKKKHYYICPYIMRLILLHFYRIFEIKEIIIIEIIFCFYFIADKYYKNYKNLFDKKRSIWNCLEKYLIIFLIQSFPFRCFLLPPREIKFFIKLIMHLISKYGRICKCRTVYSWSASLRLQIKNLILRWQKRRLFAIVD